MNQIKIHYFLNIIIASVWFVNGLVCKVLNFVPRHQEIVAAILDKNYARILTLAIGVAEIIMAIWILSRFKSKLNAFVQIFVIVIMNILEILLVPNYLLWGKLNIVFALFFSALIYYNEFVLQKKQKITARK